MTTSYDTTRDIATSSSETQQEASPRSNTSTSSTVNHDNDRPDLEAGGTKACPGVEDLEALEFDETVGGQETGLRRVIKNFTPSWFAVNMGTGVVAILLNRLPYNGIWLYWISVAFFALNVVLFALFLVLSILRYTMFPYTWHAMLRHPVQSLFLGTFPMGFSTLINMVVYVCVPAWGSWAITLAWTMWWIDAVVAVATCFYLPFVVMYVHNSHLSTMTAVWLLPIVSTIVCSATGAVVAEVLPNPQHALWTILTSYVLWGTGVPLAMVVLVLYFHRLTVHSLPPLEAIVSVFLPLGPLGQGGFAMMQLGKDAMITFPKTGTLIPEAGPFLYSFGFILAIVMFGYGLCWLFFALASITRSRFPFNMGWWGLTFPLGVFAISTCTLGKELPSRVFTVLGTILSLAVVCLWACVAAGTARKAWTGEIFYAPCLASQRRRPVAQTDAEKQL